MTKKKAPITKADRAVDRLYRAVANYVTVKGGKLVVIGGIAIQEWPEDRPMIFHVAIKCMGRKPAFVEAESGEREIG